ncbi:hypothetical protein GCM10011409_07910 [Lentibacillus populi]|uniref:Uncharacterized protein n=1 Tax=Lentibacillus populi TaxID=1827502 RepID=A0A9W5X4N4_9BACI|nr:hypothetical protein GCM10011409_07910 [Lentibacillus populi]
MKITSVIHPKSEMGKEPAKIIIDLIKLKNNHKNKEHYQVESIVYSPEIATRSSTKDINHQEIIS